MNDIRTILKVAGNRLEWTSFAGKVHIVALIAGVLILLALVMDRLGGATVLPWMWVMPMVVGAAALITLRMWMVARRNQLQVAVAVDERLDLDEKLSTALHCAKRTDAFALAAIDDAVTTARDAGVRERVRRHFKVTPPNRWWLTPLVIVLAVAVSFVPPLDLFASDAEADPIDSASITQGPDAVEILEKEFSPELQKELAPFFEDLAAELPEAPKNAEQAHLEEIKKLTRLNNKLNDLMNGKDGKTAESLKNMLSSLKKPDDGAAQGLASALAKGDFAAAKNELEKLQADLENGELSDEEREKLAEQLKDLAEQLAKLAEQQAALENMLKEMGLPPQLAQNAAALEQAIKNNQNLNEQQKQQLQQMAQAQAAACQACQGLGQGMQQMAKAMQGQPGQMGQGLGDQLAQLQGMQQMLKEAQAAADACQGACAGLGEGKGAAAKLAMQQFFRQQQQQIGQPSGGMGQKGNPGAGGEISVQKTASRTKVEQSPTKTQAAPIVAKVLFQGEQIKGDSVAKFKNVQGIILDSWEQALYDESIPRPLHEQQKHYFGQLEERVKAINRTAEDGGESAGETESTEESGD